VVKLQSFEDGVTGVREAVWLDRHLAAGGSIDDLAGGGPEDEAWDELFPQHPLSRARRLLPILLASLALDPAAPPLEPFG